MTNKKNNRTRRADCKCADNLNKDLETRGLRLKSSLLMDFTTGTAMRIHPLLEIKKIDPKNRKAKLIPIACSFCPMCGKKKPY